MIKDFNYLYPLSAEKWYQVQMKQIKIRLVNVEMDWGWLGESLRGRKHSCIFTINGYV